MSRRTAKYNFGRGTAEWRRDVTDGTVYPGNAARTTSMRGSSIGIANYARGQSGNGGIQRILTSMTRSSGSETALRIPARLRRARLPAMSRGLSSAGRIGEDHRPVLQPPFVGEPEVEPGGVHVLEQPLSCAGHDGHDPELELVDQMVSQERVVEAAGAVLDEVLAGLVLQPGDRAGRVGPEEGGVPGRLGQ